MKPIPLAGLILLLAAPAAAHSRLESSVPADGAVLAAAPARIVLSFAKRIRLTRVRVRRGDGAPADLDLSRHKGFAARFAIPLPGGGSGRYRIAWRGLSADGHVMRGRLAFRVR